MSKLPQAVQETIANWLQTGEIELFLGYERGTVPLRATPIFVRRPEDVSRLIWDATCDNNLATYLPKYRGKKVGIMVKGCDARAVVGLIQEKQAVRANLRIVGASCLGVVDPKLVARELNLPVEDLGGAVVEGDAVVRQGTRLPVAKVMHDICRHCRQHSPLEADLRVGELVEDNNQGDPFAAVREMEALDAEARWERFESELRRCNLCYACRNACPLCYCTTCFVDRTTPRWMNQTVRPEDVQFYQIIRTFHLAGRCVGCGACSRACPQGVNLRLLLDKLRADVVEIYGYEAGLDAEAKPPLATYRENDYNDFVL